MTQLQVRSLIISLCREYRELTGKSIDSTMILSIAKVESNWGLYTAGALDEIGIMQVRPATFNDIKNYVHNKYKKLLYSNLESDNILAGIFYYNELIPLLLRQFNQSDNPINRLLSYNSGIGKVVLNTACIQYIIKVLSSYILISFRLM